MNMNVWARDVFIGTLSVALSDEEGPPVFSGSPTGDELLLPPYTGLIHKYHTPTIIPSIFDICNSSYISIPARIPGITVQN
jgi:hypothetical protein